MTDLFLKVVSQENVLVFELLSKEMFLSPKTSFDIFFKDRKLLMSLEICNNFSHSSVLGRGCEGGHLILYFGSKINCSVLQCLYVA